MTHPLNDIFKHILLARCYEVAEHTPLDQAEVLSAHLGHNVFRTWRWGALLGPVRKGVRFRPMLSAIILGYMTSWIVPGRLGER